MINNEFTFDKFRNEKIAVHCGTEELAKLFIGVCKEKGFTWSDKEPLNESEWYRSGEDTCYDYSNGGVELSNIRFYQNSNYTIFNAEEIFKCSSGIKDSGNRTEFVTGAVRDIQEGKGRCDLMPLGVIARYMINNHVFKNLYGFQMNGDVLRLQMALDEFWNNYTEWNTRAAMLLEVAKHFEEGAKKYGENNWQKGIPLHSYIDSAIRHYLKWIDGWKDERHDRAFCWNILCAIWTFENMPEMDDFTKKRKGVGREPNEIHCDLCAHFERTHDEFPCCECYINDTDCPNMFIGKDEIKHENN